MFKPPNPKINAFGRFARARSGVAAVEFSLVILPFFLLTFGVAEIGMIGFAQTSLDFAVSEIGRDIRTGEAQLGGLSEDQIENLLCDDINQFLVVDCDANLFIDVARFDSFVDAAAVESPIADNDFDASGLGYDPGEPSDIVVVRAFYRWHVMTPLFENVFSNIINGDRLLVSTMMFRNEPYQ
jgi:hypothetical protein